MRHSHMLWLLLESPISFPTIILWNFRETAFYFFFFFFFGCGRISAGHSADASLAALVMVWFTRGRSIMGVSVPAGDVLPLLPHKSASCHGGEAFAVLPGRFCRPCAWRGERREADGLCALSSTPVSAL